MSIIFTPINSIPSGFSFIALGHNLFPLRHN